MSGILSAFIGRVAGVVTDAYFNLVTLLLPGNGTNGAQNNTFLDSSTNNFTITRNGNTTQGTFSPFSQTGWSNYFDGTGDYLTTPSNAAFDFWGGDFTFECWFYPMGGLSNSVIFSTGSSTTGVNLGFFSNTQVYSNQGAGSTLISGSAPTLNAWNHIALSKSGSTFALFLNGSRLGTSTSTAYPTGNQTAYIGANSANNSQVITGYVSNARLVKGSAVYDPTQTTLTVPTIPLTAITNTSLLTCQSNRFIDNSTNAFAITVNGNPSVQSFSPFAPTAAYSAAAVGGSGYFDGTGDYLTFATGQTPLLLGNSDFTFEAWVYRASGTGTASIFAGQADLNTAAGSSYVFYVSSTATSDVYIGSSSFSITSPNPTVGQWSHVAWVRTGGTYSSYLNGSRVGTRTDLSTSSVNNGATNFPPAIGGIGNGTSLLNGYISGARLIKGSGGYDATQSTITIPTSPLTAITNTSLLLNYTNAGITDATAKNDLETVGNAQISTTQSKFGGSSMYFDGTGDYLSIPASDNLVMGTGDFTIECWIYLSATGINDGVIIELRSSGATANGFVFNTRAVTSPSTGFRLNFFTDNAANLATTILAYNAWHHVAVTRSSGTVRMFANGTSDITPFTKNNNFSDKPIPTIGQSLLYTNSNITGYIDDLRITKGYARYTANFTAPTTASPLQ